MRTKITISTILNNQNDTFRTHKLSKKFKNLDIVRNPRDTINYFEEELYNEVAFNDDEKYNWVLATRRRFRLL